MLGLYENMGSIVNDMNDQYVSMYKFLKANSLMNW